jgi:primosomal protein N' (replication factor Y)
VATDLPVARVVVDISLPHLDRTFDYLVPERYSATARPGVRVRVPFAGQDVEGFVVQRVEASEHPRRLSPLRRVVSPEPVLTPPVLRLAREVADRYAGTLPDVLRLAVPARHARTEQAPSPRPPAEPQELPSPPDAGPWRDYRAGTALIARLAAGSSPRAVWTALPGARAPAQALAVAVAATLASGRGALVVLPDRRDVDVLDTELTATLGPGRHARLEADLGASARYRAFLALARGDVRVAIGTRSAAFAPVAGLGLVAIWDDGDDLHAEQRAPYPHAREVLALRAELEGAALLAGGWSRTAECAAWLRSGWAREVSATRTVRRARWPAIAVAGTAPGEDVDAAAHGRLPAAAWTALHEGLGRGPVLVQVPRAGYLPGLSCASCRRPARCAVCHGPLAQPAPPSGAEVAPPGSPSCGWCGRAQPDWSCPHCGGHRLRSRAVGVLRTAAELGRAFPGATIVLPRPGAPAPPVPDGSLVTSTPGLEPAAPGGYSAAVLLDGAVLLERPQLRASEEALRRWFAAAALVRPAGDGGRVVVCADPRSATVQALVRCDPGGHAERDLAERAALGLPPAVAIASVSGPADAVRGWWRRFVPPAGAELLGPVHDGDSGESGESGDGSSLRLIVRAPEQARVDLARALRQSAIARSARREPGPVRIQVDPLDLG